MTRECCTGPLPMALDPAGEPRQTNSPDGAPGRICDTAKWHGAAGVQEPRLGGAGAYTGSKHTEGYMAGRPPRIRQPLHVQPCLSQLVTPRRGAAEWATSPTRPGDRPAASSLLCAAQCASGCNLRLGGGAAGRRGGGAPAAKMWPRYGWHNFRRPVPRRKAACRGALSLRVSPRPMS